MFYRCISLCCLGALALIGCAPRDLPSNTPGAPGALPADYAWPPRVLSEAEAASHAELAKAGDPTLASHGQHAQPTPFVPVTPPPNGACLPELDRARVRYQVLENVRGVLTPVRIDGELGGIRYVPLGGLPLIVDCRFAMTLVQVGPLLRELGVTELYYSGAYVYRMSAKGRLSLHANGLAIDVHELVIDGVRLSVKRDFVKGLGDVCASNFPPLNRMACELRRTRAFKEFLTPDYNADHHDHLHLAIAPAASGN